MRPRTSGRQLLLFLVMSGLWGASWIAIKAGVEAMPPLLFAASRFLAAGVVLFAIAGRRRIRDCLAGRIGRVALVAILVNTATYGLIFWGVQHVASGLAAVVNLALMPIALFSIGLAFGEERYRHGSALGVGLGVLGLVILFWPRLMAGTDGLSPLGLAAIVVGTLAYCLGSVLSRPLLRETGALALSAVQMLIGGAGLVVASLILEPRSFGQLATLADPTVLASWLFLVLGGAVVGHTIYLSLIRDWGPSRAGLYAFVSPVIAVALGIVVFAESFGPFEAIGSVVMLSAAALARANRADSPDA